MEEKVDISYRSSARFMQAASQFSNMPTLAGLTQSKVFALLDLPAEERETFIAETDIDSIGDKTMDNIQQVDQLTTEILNYKKQTAQNIVEIGKRLIIVKETLSPKEWVKWVREKAGFSETSAIQYIKIAKEIK